MEKELKQKIGNTIKQYRNKKKISQIILAKRLGTQQPSIARVESGKVLPSLNFLVKIMKELGFELDIKFKIKKIL